MKHNLMFNALFETYFDWSKIKAKKNVFHQYGRQNSKWPTKLKNLSKNAKTQELCNRFQCSIACLNDILIGLEF